MKVKQDFLGERPLLSVVIPVYKTEPYLRRCLGSVLAQGVKQMEVICVNDGSPDASADILAEYAAKDKRLIVINQVNQGQAAARLTGLQAARGEWIAMVDSDDYLEPGIYKHALEFISDDVDLICFAARVAEEGSEAPASLKKYLKVKLEGKYEVTPEIINLSNVLLWNKLWRRSIITHHKVPMPLGHIHEDYVFYFAYMALARNIYVSQKIGYNYVIRPGSLTHSYESFSAEDILSYNHSWDYILEFYQAKELLTPLIDLARAKLYEFIECSRLLEKEEDAKQVETAYRKLFFKYNLQQISTPLRQLKKRATLAKWCYKLSFGKRRAMLRATHRILSRSLKMLKTMQKELS